MQITWGDIKDAAVPVAIIIGSVFLFGKLVEKNVDVDKNWQDYLKSKERKQ